ncbi:DRTGG domain-containing protein [Candidatus Caldatribacterium sp.]|uniref:DRTGG domain-containing protein n=1 Tax=Candidatus Caldatribacterium sp. TaxID=2282143 RepID=UPI00299135CD|nr:DRTGG domain-containing protein [Candidatus Caldatribacterium sp.]MDW8080440.1 DRTGG domain-containing protein [Candidatus Calescibacterium sp.]
MAVRIRDLVQPLEAVVLVPGDMEREVQGGYCGDLLSDCMANAAEGSVWVTVQSHPNVIAVAVLVGIPCVVVVNDYDVDEQTLVRARNEGITVLRTPLSAFEAVSRLSSLGVPGKKRRER